MTTKIKIPSTRDLRPVAAGGRVRFARTWVTLHLLARRAPWLFICSATCYTLAGWILHPSLGLAIAGTMFLIADLSAD